MLTNLRILISTIAFILALFSLFAQFPMLFPYVFLLLSVTLILLGIDEIQQNRKQKAFFCFLVSAVILFVLGHNLFT
ncbi:DUF3953 domain-containing protein [Bacillus cereus]|uniref:DUF3953 domain-containing protein n=1 Tax=Bacillus cereus TaxID=1396 RepID=UPI00187963F3|nr:DUF3953 domain-containing protein [Bacillus cereus]MBE7121562.1 DUF3953 domain-containing protein [Bacillus cereus]